MKPLRLGLTLAIGLALLGVLTLERSVATQQVLPTGAGAPSWIVPGSGVDGSGALRGTSTFTFPLGSTLAENTSGKLTVNGTTPMLQLGGTTSSFPALKQSGTTLLARLADDSADTVVIASQLQSSGSVVTAGSGTGITVGTGGRLAMQYYTVTIASTAFICNAVTCDVTIATLPIKTFVLNVVADLTTVYACASTCTTSTLSFTLGKTAGGNEYLLSVDADAATGRFGTTAATLGASLAPATAQTLIGDLGSWTATTAIVLRMTSGTGNIGTGAATNFSQGSVTFYVTTERML